MLIAYIFDLTNVREGSLIVLWITMLGVGLALFILTALILGNNFYLLFLLGAMDVLIVLTGSWGTLQFRWLQKDSPSVSLVMEKLLLGCLPVRRAPHRYCTHTAHARACALRGCACADRSTFVPPGSGFNCAHVGCSIGLRL